MDLVWKLSTDDDRVKFNIKLNRGIISSIMKKSFHKIFFIRQHSQLLIQFDSVLSFIMFNEFHVDLIFF